MAKAVSQDSDGDGLIDNSGFADQTYDAWIVSGPRYHIYTVANLRVVRGSHLNLPWLY